MAKRQRNVRNSMNYVPKEEKTEKFVLPSLTQPNQTLSLKQLIESNMLDEVSSLTNIIDRNKEWLEEGFDYEIFRKLDRMEQHDYLRDIQKAAYEKAQEEYKKVKAEHEKGPKLDIPADPPADPPVDPPAETAAEPLKKSKKD